MNYDIGQFGEEMVVWLREDLQFEDHGDFKNVLDRMSEERPKRCTFDLSELTSTDSAGLGMLMIAHNTSKAENWRMTIRNPIGQVRRLLEMANIGESIAIRYSDN